MKEYFARLYLKDNASEEEVKAAYRKLAKKFHPDKNIDNNDFEEEFKLIRDAYEKLNAHFANKSSEPRYKKQNTSTVKPEPNRKQKTSTTSDNFYTNAQQDNSSIKQASTNYVINGTSYKCKYCKTLFWVDRTKDEIVLCPQCKAKWSLPKVEEAFISQVTGTTIYNCGNCKKVFYADRIKDDTVICPHCKTKSTLPFAKVSNNGCVYYIGIAILLLLGFLLFWFFGVH